MSDELPTGDRAVYVFLEILAFCFALAFVDALVAQKPWSVSVRWLLLAIFFFLAGIKWPEVRTTLLGIRKTGIHLPEHRPNVLPTDYGKSVERNAFGLFVRNPGYDALDVHIPDVSLGQSVYKLVYPETKPVLCERDHIVFFEAYLEDHTSGLPGLDGSRLHDVMRLSDVERIEFPILYKGI